jgi:hypothetical protein
MENEHVIEDGYVTNQLDSASENEEPGQPRKPMLRFNEDEPMTESFKFVAGMEFSSLEQFKKAIFKHNVMNGCSVKFAKNDAKRCRMVCNKSKKCKYHVLCSRVGRTTTYRVKTVTPKHDCGRTFINKNANADFVANEIVEPLKNNSKMKLTEIVALIRSKYAVEIPACRAFKTRQLVEGDSSKQYSLLWSYSAELKRASSGNTCKLSIESPGPGLQPRFGRY